ncbi:MAG: LacI family DNA-binding transcriptional regulator [Lachnospiraceae bacterium]|nr:LacI family DNA-binding transcriptional regulator [Lachnospiraceae bacterium]
MSVTLQQIADMAGVHKSTVDKVVHNRPGVSDAKRQMIKNLLKENGYESNPLAKALNYQKKKMKVVVVMPEVDAMPFLRQGMELVQQDFNSFNIEVIYHTMAFSDPNGQAAYLRSLEKEGVSGVVLLPIETPEVAEAAAELNEKGIPVITINSDLEQVPHLCFVGQDVTQAGRTAARIMGLLLPNSAELAVISSRHMRAVKQREQSFLDYLPQAAPNLHVNKLELIEENAESAYQNTAALLREHPELNAILITCGEVSNVCRAIRDSERAGKMTVVCYERYPVIAELLKQGEVDATISGDLGDQGRLAMRLLFEYLIYGRKPESDRMLTRNEIFLKENI